MQTALIPQSRSEILQSPDWPALPSKSAPPVSALRRGSSHPGSTQKNSPAARPKPAHTPGSTAHGESSFPADPAPSASASPKHVLSCPSVYQFTPTPRSINLQVDRSPAVIQNLTQPSQTQIETHSPPPSQSPPPSIQSSTHSDIPLPTTCETSPDHPWKSSPPPRAAKTPPTGAPPSSPYSCPTALPAPPSANCSLGRSPAESLFPQASPSTPHPESRRFHAQSAPRPESQSPHESFPARQFPPHASAGEIHTPRHVHKLPEIPLSPNSSHLHQFQTPQFAVIRTAAPPAPCASQPPPQTAAPHQKSSSAATLALQMAPWLSGSQRNSLPASAAEETSRPPKASP